MTRTQKMSFMTVTTLLSGELCCNKDGKPFSVYARIGLYPKSNRKLSKECKQRRDRATFAFQITLVRMWKRNLRELARSLLQSCGPKMGGKSPGDPIDLRDTQQEESTGLSDCDHEGRKYQDGQTVRFRDPNL